MVSRRCDQCSQVKPCQLYVEPTGHVVYLCKPCARLLEYAKTEG